MSIARHPGSNLRQPAVRAAVPGITTHVPRRGGYVLLETVVATSMLILGLAFIGGMIQDSHTALRRVERTMRARMLAEDFLTELERGLIELESVDEIQEEEFGPRYPSWGWRLTIQETAVAELYMLTVEVLYQPRSDIDEADFDFDDAEVLYTLHTLRPVPRPLNFAEDFGLTDEEFNDISEKLSQLGVDGLDANNFDPAILSKLDFDQLIDVLPVMMDAFGMDLGVALNALPPDVRQALEESGALEGILGGGGEESE